MLIYGKKVPKIIKQNIKLSKYIKRKSYEEVKQGLVKFTTIEHHLNTEILSSHRYFRL